MRTRRDEDAIGVGLGVINVNRIAETDIEGMGIELGNWPDRVDVELRSNDDVILLVGLGEIDVIVVLDAERDAKEEADRTEPYIE